MCDNHYIFLKPIGKGGQGSVYLAYSHLLKKNVCIKKTLKSMAFEKRAVCLMRKVNHPHFPKTLDEYEDEFYYYHVMEYIEGKTLVTYFKKMNRSQSIDIGLQLLEMIDDLKNSGLTFNDLKPDNILITQHHNAYIIDYGSVLPIGDDTSKRYGSLYFSSPEYIQKKKVTWKSDVYSVGKILQYICHKPNSHLLKWISKATNKQEENRFETLIQAYLKLNKRHYFLFFMQLSMLVLLILSLHSLYTRQLYQLSLSTKQEAILFHSLDCYRELDEAYKYKLSNLIMNENDSIYWDIQKALCAKETHPYLSDRNLFLNRRKLEGLNLNPDNLHFYIRYLFVEEDHKHLQQAYYFLRQQPQTKIIQETQIEIAFYLNKNEWLLEDYRHSVPEIKAYSLYRLFQLGYYNHGYLHQALHLLEKSTDEQLIKKITIAIEQWGEDA